MGKYSSDSDYEKRSGKRSESRKSSRRRRSDSSDSSESRSRRGNRSKRTRRSRSRSREKYSRSRRSKSSSRSSSRLNSKYRSNRRSKSKSRDRDRRSKLRRSRSRSYIREYTNRPRRRTSSSSDSSSSGDNRNKNRRETRVPKKDSAKPSGKINPPPITKSEKLESVVSATKEEMPQFDSSTLDEINSDGFAPKPFYSEKKLMENIVINLKDQTIKVPEAENKQSEEAASLFHHNLFASEEARMQKWVKELYTYRQKALQQGVRRK